MCMGMHVHVHVHVHVHGRAGAPHHCLAQLAILVARELGRNITARCREQRAPRARRVVHLEHLEIDCAMDECEYPVDTCIPSAL